jgi:hypothetical protein
VAIDTEWCALQPGAPVALLQLATAHRCLLIRTCCMKFRWVPPGVAGWGGAAAGRCLRNGAATTRLRRLPVRGARRCQARALQGPHPAPNALLCLLPRPDPPPCPHLPLPPPSSPAACPRRWRTSCRTPTSCCWPPPGRARTSTRCSAASSSAWTTTGGRGTPAAAVAAFRAAARGAAALAAARACRRGAALRRCARDAGRERPYAWQRPPAMCAPPPPRPLLARRQDPAEPPPQLQTPAGPGRAHSLQPRAAAPAPRPPQAHP